jgi:hypothetical protein
MDFKQWLESVDFFPRPEDLNAFINHAIKVCIETHQAMFANAKTQKEQAVMNQIITLTELLQHIQKNIEDRIYDPDSTAGDKFQGKPSPSLTHNQYPHKFPNLPSVIRVLQTIGGHYFIEKPSSQALSDQLRSLLQAWNLAKKSALHQDQSEV